MPLVKIAKNELKSPKIVIITLTLIAKRELFGILLSKFYYPNIVIQIFYPHFVIQILLSTFCNPNIFIQVFFIQIFLSKFFSSKFILIHPNYPRLILLPPSEWNQENLGGLSKSVISKLREMEREGGDGERERERERGRGRERESSCNHSKRIISMKLLENFCPNPKMNFGKML
jgi:hypothetical protein